MKVSTLDRGLGNSSRTCHVRSIGSVAENGKRYAWCQAMMLIIFHAFKICIILFLLDSNIQITAAKQLPSFAAK
jgi:hypothetical protein